VLFRSGIRKVTKSIQAGQITLPIIRILKQRNCDLAQVVAAVCKAGKVEWCKIYLNKDSKLLEQPDKLAAT
jgi:hypothetical protein